MTDRPDAPRRYRQSAGILLFRRASGSVEVMLGHPGGPFWAHKDDGSWTIFKGEFDDSAERPVDAARREFAEETGFESSALCETDFLDLGTVRQSSGKLVYAFACEGDGDSRATRSNLFDLEWPPRSGRFEQHPEIDRAEWFDLASARTKIMRGQLPFLDRLESALGPE